MHRYFRDMMGISTYICRHWPKDSPDKNDVENGHTVAEQVCAPESDGITQSK